MKIALVYRASNPTWVSAQTIRENLKRAWLAIELLQVIDCPFTMDQDWSAWAKTLQKTKPDLIVFLESMPVPVKALNAISKIKTLKKIPFIFHIYGDFSINTHKWFNIGPLLTGRRILWLVASAAQQGQLTQFLNPGADVQCVPFPVDSETYNPFDLQKENLQQSYRFFYTGRFSRQKNTLLLLQWVAEYLQKNPNVNFDFAGPFDDLGGELWGDKEPAGSTHSKWMTVLKSLPPQVRARIHYHGNLSAREVKTLATQSDCYISLSTYHDEDFGLAPLESLMCGSRAILSGWGGFTSFKIDENSVEILPVEIAKDSIKLNKNRFFKALNHVMQKKKVSIEERHLRHLIYSSHFSIAAVSDELKNKLNSPFEIFTGFSSFTQLHSDLVLKHWLCGGLVYNSPGTSDPVYEHVYRSYAQT